MAAKYRLTTLGCKVNQYESQQIRELFDSLGLSPARTGETPDIAVVNTCAVTGRASGKSRQAIRRATQGGHTPVVIIGCGASADAERLSALDGVLAILGHEADICTELGKLVTHRLESTRSRPRRAGPSVAEATVGRPDAGRKDGWMMPVASVRGRQGSASRAADAPSSIMTPDVPAVKADRELRTTVRRFARHRRAFLKVQDGCDAFCTYCIIPKLRSNLRSKPVPIAVAEAEQLVRSGHKEIIVTGIFLGAYGRDTARASRGLWSTRSHDPKQRIEGRTSARARARSAPGTAPLVELVDALSQVPGLRRLRLSSLEPGDVTESLLAVLASHETCVPHLHLPLQSGSGAMLRRMNRQYTPEAYVEMVDRVRNALDRPAITTDIIVGFPGETDADFEASLDVARCASFLKIHAFPFSPRAHTAAARWTKDFVPPAVVRERMQRLARVERTCSLAYRRTLLGCVERVLVERTKSIDIDPRQPSADRCPRRAAIGRADRYFEVHMDGAELKPGDVVFVRLDRVTPTRTCGTHLSARPDTIRRLCGALENVAPVCNR